MARLTGKGGGGIWGVAAKAIYRVIARRKWNGIAEVPAKLCWEIKVRTDGIKT